MDSREVSKLRQKLEEAFPDKTSEERESMFESLVNIKSATEVYYQTIDGNITRVGVILGNSKMKSYYSTKYDMNPVFDE